LFIFSGDGLFLLEEYSSCDTCDRPELGRTPEKLNEHSDNYTFEIYIKTTEYPFVLFCPCIVNDYNLLVPKKCAYYPNIYFTLSGSYMFGLVAILRELTTK